MTQWIHFCRVCWRGELFGGRIVPRLHAQQRKTKRTGAGRVAGAMLERQRLAVWVSVKSGCGSGLELRPQSVQNERFV